MRLQLSAILGIENKLIKKRIIYVLSNIFYKLSLYSDNTGTCYVVRVYYTVEDCGCNKPIVMVLYNIRLHLTTAMFIERS